MIETNVKRIAVVQGAPSAAVQATFRDLIDRWRPTLRLAGVVAEDHGLPDRKCSAGYLRDIATGIRYPIFQDSGQPEACHLEGGGALAASAAIEKEITAGCDLVVLSKFGKLEAAGQGLARAFEAAIAADVPILTSVSPAFENAWTDFAAAPFSSLPADPGRIESWFRALGRAPAC